jgi:hypothetical protein
MFSCAVTWRLELLGHCSPLRGSRGLMGPNKVFGV